MLLKQEKQEKLNRREKASSSGDGNEVDMGLDEYKYNYAVRKEGLN